MGRAVLLLGVLLGLQPFSTSAQPIGAEKPSGSRQATPSTAYVLEYVSNELRFHPVDDYTDQTTVGGQDMFLAGLDFDESATTLYAVDSSSGMFGTLDLQTAAFNPIGPTGALWWSGLTVDPSEGTVYAVRSAPPNELYIVDPSTGLATLVGEINGVPGFIVDIAMNCDGDLYAHDFDSDSIYLIDTTTADGTLVGPTGLDASFAQGMDFDNATNTLYAWFLGVDTFLRYGVIDTSTGELSVLFDDTGVDYEGSIASTCSAIFADGFESGDTSAWSSTIQ